MERHRRLELRLRHLIERALGADRPNWWQECIPEKIRNVTEGEKRKSERPSPIRPVEEYHLVDYLYFRHYEQIITVDPNWEGAFRTFFERREWIEGIRAHVRRHDIAAWIADQLADLDTGAAAAER